MLQQTQVDRVIPKYRAFLKRFPTVAALASASQRDVVRMWSGLGYNSRALRLHRAARAIRGMFGGKVPRSVEELEGLPGIGPYTARAIAAFAFQQDTAAVDTNQNRVMGRYFFGGKKIATKAVRKLATSVLPRGGGYEWNHALMDFGAMVCTSRPLCPVCPLQSTCAAYPEVLQQKRTQRSRVSRPFIGSDRFFRGRIIELLRRTRAWSSEKEVREKLRQFSHLRSPRLRRLIYDLRDEGFVEQTVRNGQTFLRLH